MNKTEEYIKSHWDQCVRENQQDEDSLLGLPYPYTVPAIGHFNELYYWDTFFTNKGLALSGRYDLMKNNVDDMLYLVNRYGFMPNGNRTWFLSRSQPPFLSEMVLDVYEHYHDPVWLEGAYHQLEREYQFWMCERMSPVGLNVYGGQKKPEEEEASIADFKKRVGCEVTLSDQDVYDQYLFSAESGWDMNPRWGFEAKNFVPVDLNSLLYCLENNMRYFAEILENGQAELWASRASMRRDLMNQYMDRGDGVLLDYNFVKKEHGKVLSAASFYPLYAGLVTPEQAAAATGELRNLEADHGILTCVQNDTPGNYQWDYPNGWACLQYMTIMGLDRYGFKKEAKRISEKYVKMVEKVFEESGNLWEKYNVVEGNINVQNEYGLPPMMGWSAGVYLAAKKYLEQ